ncbi:agamous-like MADS-box protein AGL61 [Juglans microcarpa x Juglans regia]|uniref:agamous-like MADS-box protein AGL61 n=1 Tax=Juglans microcarpa x Juglans regia TaxID=2249226 RepID=UPI001B7F4D23|nr:agamous-like MADS-box protein AGL61 [Juglans microcarpa x Juglans regia]
MAMATTDQKIKKITQGRRKIEIKQLENKSTKHVTFSKRRAGLFKKASELCVLCGVNIAIIAYSPGEKAYSFSHPNVDTVLNSYLTGNALPAYSAVNPWPVEEFNKKYAESLKELEDEKKRLADIDEDLTSKKKMRNNIGFLWDEPIDGMGIEELEQYLAAMKEMRAKCQRQQIRLGDYHDHHEYGNCLSGSGTGEDVGSTSSGGFGLGINNYQFGNLSSTGGDNGGDFGASSCTGIGLGNYQFCSNYLSTAPGSGGYGVGDYDHHLGTSTAGYGFGVQ